MTRHTIYNAPFHDYDGARRYLQGGRNPHDRPVMNNTRVEMWGASIAIHYHNTDIMWFCPSGRIELRTGGWFTSTTKQRMNAFLPPPWAIYQEKGVWYLQDRSHHATYNDEDGLLQYVTHHEPFVFQDGITIHLRDGSVTGAAPRDATEAAAQLSRQIRDYVKAYVGKLLNGELPPPRDIDVDLIRVHERTPALRTQLKEVLEVPTYPPALIRRAMDHFGVGQVVKQTINLMWAGLARHEDLDMWGNICRLQLTSSLRRYLRLQLGLGN